MKQIHRGLILTFIVLLALLIPVSAFAFETEHFVGTWSIVSGIERGLRTELSDPSLAGITIEFSEDGTARLTADGQTQTATYAYSMGYTYLILKDGAEHRMYWQDTSYGAFYIENRENYVGVVFERAEEAWQPEITPEPWLTADGFRYELLADGTARILASTSMSDHLEIPAELDGAPVTVIASDAFAGDYMSSITFPETLITVEDSAFSGCEYLTELNFPVGVKSIGNSIAVRCHALETVVLPDGLETLGEGAFQGCQSLSSVTIGTGLTVIPDLAFAGCALTSIVIPEGVLSIGKMAFAESPVEHAALPSTLESVGMYAFMSDLTIHGESGSAAEDYAKQARFAFTTEPLE